MHSTPTGIADNSGLHGLFQLKSTLTLHTSLLIKNPLQKDLRFSQIRRKRLHFSHRIYAAVGKSSSGGSSGSSREDDFMKRVLEENPSLVEPRYKIGDKFYTLKEKENLLRKNHQINGVMEMLKRLNLKGMKTKKGESGVEYSKDVHLNDLLREFKGKLYVPEGIFTEGLSEEEQFDKDLELLPRMSFENFLKALKGDKIKFLKFKEDDEVSAFYGYKDFIMELKEIPGHKNQQRTKWSVKVEEDQVQRVMEEYTGPRYEIEKQTMSCVEKLPEYPNPVALSISSKVIVELGVVTAAIAAAAAVLGGFIASAAFAVTSFVYAWSVSVIWPMVKPRLVSFGDVQNIIRDIRAEKSAHGWILSKLYRMFTYGPIYSSLRMIVVMLIVFAIVALLLLFTIARKPKDFNNWDIWQGIQFSQSKPHARVDGSTGVTFSDVAGIDIAVQELQEV